MFTSVYSDADIKAILDNISEDFPNDAGGLCVSTNYELQEDIASLSTKIAIQGKLISKLLFKVQQLENSLPLIGL